MASQRCHYDVLGIKKCATEDEIKKTFRVLAKQYHPDKNSDAGAEEKFKEISAAYDTLKDGAKKRLYDMEQKTDELRAQNAKAEKERAEKMKKSASFSFTTNNGTNFTFQSTYSTFTDDKEDKKKDKEENGKENKSKKKEGKKTGKQYRGSKTFSFSSKKPDWDEETSKASSSKGPKVSFQFGFTDDPMEDMEDMFDSFMEDSFFGMPGQFGFQAKKKQPKKSTWEEDIWNWSKPMFTKNKADELYEDQKSMKGPAKDYTPKVVQFPCAYCGIMFSAERVKKHEKTCAMKQTSDEIPGTSYQGRSESRNRTPSPPPPPRPPWRSVYEEEEEKPWARGRENGFTKESSPDPTRGMDFVKCIYCMREFSATAANSHMARCDAKKYQSSNGYASTSSSSRVSPPRSTAGSTTYRSGRDYMDEPADSTSSGLYSSTPRRSSNIGRGGTTLNAGSSSTPEFDREEVQKPSPETAYDRYQKRYYADMQASWKKSSSSDFLTSDAAKDRVTNGFGGDGGAYSAGTTPSSRSYDTTPTRSFDTSHEPTPTPSEPSSTRSGSRERSTTDFTGEDNVNSGSSRYGGSSSSSNGPTINIRPASADGTSKRYSAKKNQRGVYVGLEDLAEDSDEDRYARKQQEAEFSHARKVFSAPQDNLSDFASRYLSSSFSSTNAYVPTPSVPSSSSSNYTPASSSSYTPRYQTRYTTEPSSGATSSSTRQSRIDSTAPVIHLRTSSEPAGYRSRISTSSGSSGVHRGYTGTGHSSTSTRPAARTNYTSSYHSTVHVPASGSSSSSYGSGSYASGSSSYASRPYASSTYSSSSNYGSGLGSYGLGGSSYGGSSSYGTGGSSYSTLGSGSYLSGSSSAYSGLSYSNLADSYAGRVPNYHTSVYSTSVA